MDGLLQPAHVLPGKREVFGCGEVAVRGLRGGVELSLHDVLEQRNGVDASALGER